MAINVVPHVLFVGKCLDLKDWLLPRLERLETQLCPFNIMFRKQLLAWANHRVLRNIRFYVTCEMCSAARKVFDDIFGKRIIEIVPEEETWLR